MGNEFNFNKRMYICVLMVVLTMFLGIGSVSAATYSTGIECLYESNDEYFLKTNYVKAGSSYQGADDRDTFIKEPVVCGIAAWESTNNKYHTYMHCKTKNGYELGVSENYDAIFNKGKAAKESTLKEYFGYVKDKGVSKCPDNIWFSNIKFSAVEVASGSLDGKKLLINKTKKETNETTKKEETLPVGMKRASLSRINKKLSSTPYNDTLTKIDNLLAGKSASPGSDYVGVPGAGPSDYNGGLNGGDTTLPSGTGTIDVTDIIDYYNKNGDSDTDTSISKDDELDCHAALGDDVADLIKKGFMTLAVVGVILLVITMTFDFIKAITSGEGDALPKVFKNSVHRIIAVIVLLLLPLLINTIVDVVNNNLVTDGNGKIKIGDVSECLGSD